MLSIEATPIPSCAWASARQRPIPRTATCSPCMPSAWRKAIATDRRDPWAHHAVAHCLEARGRLTDGVAFLQSMSDTWESCNSFMYTHNWWHLALFLIDLDRGDEALALYD